jgi:MFS family permease
MKNIKNALFIQGINVFAQGSLEVLLPLLLIERNIRIEYIGLIFALGPIIFQLSRMVLAVISDFFGRKKFFIINSILDPLSILVYYFAVSPLGFAVGKIVDQLSSASFWSVNRAFLLEQGKDKKRNLVYMRIVDNISQASGRFIIGFLIVYIFFYNALLFLFVTSLFLIPFALTVKDKVIKKKFNFTNVRGILNLNNKKKDFKKFLLFYSFWGLSNGIIFTGYVIPLFLNSKNFSPEIIGVLLGVQLFIAGITAYFIKKLRLRHILITSAILYIIFISLLNFVNYYMLAIFIALLLGITIGFIYIGNEFMFSHITGKESYATDLALAIVGFHAGRSISEALAGFLIPSFGYISVFLYSILTFLVFSIGSYTIFKDV